MRIEELLQDIGILIVDMLDIVLLKIALFLHRFVRTILQESPEIGKY